MFSDTVFHFHTSAQRKDAFLLPVRGRQKKKANRYAIVGPKYPRSIMLIVFPPLNEKQ
jgi:hypothetical protein